MRANDSLHRSSIVEHYYRYSLNSLIVSLKFPFDKKTVFQMQKKSLRDILQNNSSIIVSKTL